MLSQTITFDQPLDATVGQQVTLSAATDAREPQPLPVSLRSDTPQVCTVSGFTSTPTAPGTCVITASQGGDDSYLPAPDVARAFRARAGPEPQTIIFDQPTAAAVGELVTLTASSATSTSPPAETGLTVSFRSDTPAVCTISGSTVTTTTADVCTITASQGGSATYAAAQDVQRSFQAYTGSDEQTITFDPLPNAAAGESFPLTASSVTSTPPLVDTGLTVSFRSDTPWVCTVSGSAITTVTAGACAITAFQGGSATYAAALDVPQSFQVTTGRDPQQIWFSPVPGATVGVPVVLSATAGPQIRVEANWQQSLTVSFRSETRRVCTVSGATVIPETGGTCTIIASQGGSADYLPAVPVPQSFPVERATQTITFPPPAATTFGQLVTLTATASSGLPVSYTSNTPAVCTVSGSTVTTLTSGSCAITAAQAGDDQYAPANSRSQKFPVDPASQTITFPEPAATTFGQLVTLTATASSGLPVSYTSNTPAVCTVSGSTVTTLTSGSCAITAAQAGDDQYAPANSRSQKFPVDPASQTITFPPFKGARVGQPITLTATASSGLPVSYRADAPAVCSVKGSIVTSTDRGTCTITAAQAGDDRYAPAESMTRSFPVKRISQTISFTPPTGATISQQVTLTAKASSGLAVSYTSSPPAVCKVSGATITPTAGGTCTITAAQAGDDRYAPAESMTRSFPVKRISQTIDFPQPQDTRFGRPVTLSASASSGLAVSYSSGTPACSVSGATVTTVTAGTCAITAAQAGNDRFAPARDVGHSFQVERASQTITFTPPDGTTIGRPVTLSASASSGLAVSYSSGTPEVCTVSGATVTTTTAGTCTITAAQAGDDRYAAAPDVPRSFRVRTSHAGSGKTSQTITFGQPPSAALGQPVPLFASDTSGLTVSFRSGTPAVCTISGATVTTTTAGTCTITAAQAGDDRYAAAPDVQRSFQVHPGKARTRKTSQTITFGHPQGAAVGQPVPLSASTTSGLAVSFRSDTPAVCTVSGATVTTTTAGTCLVTASQAGSGHYLAAPDVAQSFQVHAGHRAQTITFPQPPEAKVGGPVVLSASASSGLAVSFRSDTPRVCTVSGATVTTAAAGTCLVTASQGGSDRYAAARDVGQSFPVNPGPSIVPGALAILLAALVFAAAGVTTIVRRVRLRSRRPPAPHTSVRAVPDPGPPGLVSVHNTGAGVTHAVRIESRSGASITTIKEGRP